jgi:hypothetical protein
MKKLIYLLFIATAAVAVACNNSQTKENKTEEKTAVNETFVSIDSFLVIAKNYVGKELTVKGTVDHVCKHGGKRVKIISTGTGESIHGEASENMGIFDAKLEGNDIYLTGIVKENRIDSAYLDKWEKSIKEKDDEAVENSQEHKGGVDHHAKLQEIEDYRKQIADSPEGYISFYYLEVSKYGKCKE